MYLTDTVRYEGDVVALVAAESRELVQDALDAIAVEYEPLDAVFDVRSAMLPGAHVVHEAYPDNVFTPSIYHIKKGDTAAAFARADLIVEREYETQYAEHAYIEPEAVLAFENPNEGGMTVLSSSQNPFFTRRYVADILGTSMNRVQITSRRSRHVRREGGGRRPCRGARSVSCAADRASRQARLYARGIVPRKCETASLPASLQSGTDKDAASSPGRERRLTTAALTTIKRSS
jgi:xanthine dehydrogenase molybdopterin-binding subunit B